MVKTIKEVILDENEIGEAIRKFADVPFARSVLRWKVSYNLEVLGCTVRIEEENGGDHGE